MNGRRVFVVVGHPQPCPAALDSGYLCRVRIEGLEAKPLGLYATGSQPVEALNAGLSTVTDRLGMKLADFLADAYVGTGTPASPDVPARFRDE